MDYMDPLRSDRLGPVLELVLVLESLALLESLELDLAEVLVALDLAEGPEPDQVLAELDLAEVLEAYRQLDELARPYHQPFRRILLYCQRFRPR